ncbi:unnamed protein product [Heterobilharzia americana]|nr:unnamed protein product [Heterobilharzia americana]
MGKFINMKFMVFFVLSLLSVQNVKGGPKNSTEVVFNLRSFLVSIWLSFCSHYADTLRFFLRGLPKSLGGDENK